MTEWDALDIVAKKDLQQAYEKRQISLLLRRASKNSVEDISKKSKKIKKKKKIKAA